MKRIMTFLTFLFLTVPIAVMARWRGDGMGYGGGCDFGRYFTFGGRGIMMILIFIILILLIIWAVKAIKTGNTNPFKSQDPLTILKTRYAKGEISKEEFNEMKKEL
jgi:putative membrane protein